MTGCQISRLVLPVLHHLHHADIRRHIDAFALHKIISFIAFLESSMVQIAFLIMQCFSSVSLQFLSVWPHTLVRKVVHYVCTLVATTGCCNNKFGDAAEVARSLSCICAG